MGPEDFVEFCIAGTMALNEITAERNVVRMCIHELPINGYIISDFSTIRCEAFHEGNEDVAAVSEMTARGNETGVV